MATLSPGCRSAETKVTADHVSERVIADMGAARLYLTADEAEQVGIVARAGRRWVLLPYQVVAASSFAANAVLQQGKSAAGAVAAARRAVRGSQCSHLRPCPALSTCSTGSPRRSGSNSRQPIHGGLVRRKQSALTFWNLLPSFNHEILKTHRSIKGSFDVVAEVAVVMREVLVSNLLSFRIEARVIANAICQQLNLSTIPCQACASQPDFASEGVKPRQHRNYAGRTKGVVLVTLQAGLQIRGRKQRLQTVRSFGPSLFLQGLELSGQGSDFASKEAKDDNFFALTLFKHARIFINFLLAGNLLSTFCKLIGSDTQLPNRKRRCQGHTYSSPSDPQSSEGYVGCGNAPSSSISIPPGFARRAQRPALNHSIQHAHSLILMWTRPHSAMTSNPEVCRA